MATTLVDSVIHWRKKLDKNLDEDTILHVIRKLSKVPITLEILETTHIGKTIRKLSKRDDIVGEKALAVLRKWRFAFASADRNPSKSSSVSKKENINKKLESSCGYDDLETFYESEISPLSKPRPERNSFSHSSSQQTRTDLNNSPKNRYNTHSTSSPSIYTYVKKESHAKYMDYDPHADVSEGYNPECPELFPSEKPRKMRKLETSEDQTESLIETRESKPSLKHKVKTDDRTESSVETRELKPPLKHKLKTEDQRVFLTNVKHKHTDCSDKSKKSEEKKEKHNVHKSKDPELFSSNVKKEPSVKVKSESLNNEKQKLHSDAKKSKNKECDGKSNGKSNKSKEGVKINSAEEFTSSDVKFEDCLGFNDIVTLKKKKSSNAKSQLANKKIVTTKDTNRASKKSTKSNSSVASVVEKKISKDSSSSKMHVNIPKPATMEVDIFSTLPETQPNYLPLPQRNLDYFSPKKREVLTNEDAIRFTSSRREKTAVYSGRKSFFTEVPSLFECCTRVLIEHIDAIEYLGDVPYFILKPILERCSPNQLFNIEHYNPYLLDETSELWEIHCRRDYKLLSREENETWRELYLRAHDEREKKLKSLTANISASMSKSNPVRQVKLAFVDSFVKPPRDVARRQAKNGTAHPVKQPVKAVASSKVTSKPAAPVSISAPTSSGNASLVPKKPKVAPLMAKTLKSMKQCFRR